MPAPKGHKMWGNPVKPKSYSTEKLWKVSCEYFEWVNENPWMLIEQPRQPQKLPKDYSKRKYGSIENFTSQVVKIPQQRAYSIEALCNYLDISKSTFERYSKESEYETYWDTCSRIKQIIDAQHFEGGMVGAFNANIVTRKLGLADKQELTGKDGKDLVTTMTFVIDKTAKQDFASNETDVH